jgi:hypothetical protein
MTDVPDARDHAAPCRPTVSCTADIAAPGTLEVETGLLATGSSEQTRAWTYPFLLKQTLSKLLQIQIASNGFTTVHGLAPAQYLDNVGLGAKLHLRDQGDVFPSLAVTALVSVPTFDRDGYLRVYDGFFTGHASKDVAWLHIDWNVGLNVWRLESAPVAQGFTALALSTSLSASVLDRRRGLRVHRRRAHRAARRRPARGPRHDGAAVARFRRGRRRGVLPVDAAYSAFIGMTIIPVVWWRS